MNPDLRHSLRFRLAATFVWFGALLSLLLALGLSLTAHTLGERLMDETLRAEIEDYMTRRLRNPNSLPPATISVRGYVHTPGRAMQDMPPALLQLKPGKHQLTLDNIPYRVAVVDKGDERYVMLFNEIRQRHREQQFIIYLVIGALIMTFISAVIGWLLAGKIVAPVAKLAQLVAKAKPEDKTPDIVQGFSNDEIGQLARVFSGYLNRMRAFIDRERAFTADVSHELRTPLAIVQGAVELMEADPHLADKQRERLARVKRAAKGMVDLTAALLLMAREETAAGMIEQECDVCEAVTDAVDAHRYLLSPNTQIELTCRTPVRLAVERTLLGIVIANLIRNAFSYTESGMVSVSVAENCLIVTDTGAGIREEEISRVFQRHFKGASSTGAGIGLSLVKRICDRYGWDMVIESTEGHGTTARLFFTRPAVTAPLI